MDQALIRNQRLFNNSSKRGILKRLPLFQFNMLRAPFSAFVTICRRCILRPSLSKYAPKAVADFPVAKRSSSVLTIIWLYCRDNTPFKALWSSFRCNVPAKPCNFRYNTPLCSVRETLSSDIKDSARDFSLTGAFKRRSKRLTGSGVAFC